MEPMLKYSAEDMRKTMTKFTTTSLIKLLKEFPKDLPIETELSLLWNYPDELRKYYDKIPYDEYEELTIQKATDLCIFEGSWEKDNISDVDGKLKEFLKVE